MERPRDAISLLKNAKTALDYGLPLREDFYSDQNLRRFFGGHKIDWTEKDKAGVRWGELAEFDHLVEPMVAGGSVYEGLSIRLLAALGNSGKGHAVISFYFSTPRRPSFAEVENIFGPKWKHDGDTQMPSLHSIQNAPTRPHGNELIDYDASGDGWLSRMSFQFLYDGTLDHAEFSTREGGHGG